MKDVEPKNLILERLSQCCAMSLAVLLAMVYSIGGVIGVSVLGMF